MLLHWAGFNNTLERYRICWDFSFIQKMFLQKYVILKTFKIKWAGNLKRNDCNNLTSKFFKTATS